MPAGSLVVSDAFRVRRMVRTGSNLALMRTKTKFLSSCKESIKSKGDAPMASGMKKQKDIIGVHNN
ncbi:hypothetical protein C9I98_07195 [Photobacterium sanctipauli]|uniref:Uncharacterized protein n=1 Tax=Photobacterium sanctipauli TaxID=1342794 RepID=A0A2T3NWE9_9GAMM|nr:hypothetical protein C9I98_07195 [Photobacterium sanctipauli]